MGKSVFEYQEPSMGASPLNRVTGTWIILEEVSGIQSLPEKNYSKKLVVTFNVPGAQIVCRRMGIEQFDGVLEKWSKIHG